jgi:hypothetical protein
MSDHAYAGWLTQADLTSLLATPPAACAWMLIEAVDELVLTDFDKNIDLIRYPTGRIFGSLCEVRWQRDGKLFHTLLVGNIAQPPMPSMTYHQELCTTDFDYVAQQYYLWGAWSNELPEWVEASIPHRFDYPSPPVQGTWRRKLAVLEYLHRHTGEMEFYRFMSLDMEQL